MGSAIPGLVISAIDEAENHTITYSIDPDSEDASTFSINSDSGQISLAHEVDYEDPTDQTLTFIVSASSSSFLSVVVYTGNQVC